MNKVNIFICYTQGFLTVFSGEPGTGKTSICKILASVLGLAVPEKAIPKYKDGYIATRFIPVSVERGWTTKRDFIGYYNPLTKAFDRSNRKMFDALNIMHLEANGQSTDMPFMILLDEANLSPMEYYWADFMNICDDIDCTSVINLGDDFSFNVPRQLRFVATINNDHTTEALSPRLVDRAWVIKLPRVRSGMVRPVTINTDGDEVIAWSALVSTFSEDTLLRNSIGRYVTEEPLKTVPLPASDDEENTTPSPTLAVVEPKEPETSAQGNTASRPAEDLGTATSEESHSSFAEKQNVSQNSTMTSREKGSQKKKPPKAIDTSALHLSELKLDKDIEARLIGAGYTTIQDLVPNKLKSDLVSNPILNRKSRREIEARLKQRKIPLR